MKAVGSTSYKPEERNFNSYCHGNLQIILGILIGKVLKISLAALQKYRYQKLDSTYVLQTINHAPY